MDPATYVSPASPTNPVNPIQPVQTTPQEFYQQPFGWKKILGITALVVFLMGIWTWISSPMIVTVTGTGQVNVPATNATITLALITGDPTPQGAIASVNTKANVIKNFLKSMGISEENIATSQVTAVPAALTTNGGTGYRATISMSAKTTGISSVANLVALLYSNGVDAVSQPVLSVENENALDAQAYNSAMQDAGKKAASIALKNWKIIKKIVNVNSQSSGTTSTATSNTDTVQNGVFKIVEAVSVSYKMW